jgi:hypothetical protein
MKDFSELTEPELLALAIALEEEDSRIYEEFAHGLRANYPDTARMFSAMSEEESGHRHCLLDLYRVKFGEHLPLIRRQDVKGFVERKPVWMTRPLGLEKVREQAELMEAETKRFYSATPRHILPLIIGEAHQCRRTSELLLTATRYLSPADQLPDCAARPGKTAHYPASFHADDDMQRLVDAWWQSARNWAGHSRRKRRRSSSTQHGPQMQLPGVVREESCSA